MADHILLPCHIESCGCETATKTYIWILPKSKCSLEEERTNGMSEVNGYLVDKEHKILLKKGTLVPETTGCPTTLLYSTEYPSLFQTTLGEEWLDMSNDLDLADFIKARNDYIMFQV